MHWSGQPTSLEGDEAVAVGCGAFWEDDDLRPLAVGLGSLLDGCYGLLSGVWVLTRYRDWLQVSHKSWMGTSIEKLEEILHISMISVLSKCPTHAPLTIALGVNHNVIARTKSSPNPNPIPYPILNLKVNHYHNVKPFLP